jgi:ABC-type transport system involved in cytochrome bd biosynthesis fused ATPase/permease subunit
MKMNEAVNPRCEYLDSLYPVVLSPLPQMVWLVVFFSTLVIGLDIGLGIGILFHIFVIIFQTVLPYATEVGEARAWHYPPGQLLEDFDEAELKVSSLPCTKV